MNAGETRVAVRNAPNSRHNWDPFCMTCKLSQPELVGRCDADVFFKEPVALEEFQIQTPAGMGVRMICPSCRTNEFVQPPGVSRNGYNMFSTRIRVAHNVDGVMIPLTGKHRCKNPACALVRGSARSKAEKEEQNQGGQQVSDIVWNDAAVISRCADGVSFNTMGDSYMQLLPAEIQAMLPYRWFTQNGTSLKLLDMVRGLDGDVQEKDNMTGGILGLHSGRIIKADTSDRVAGKNTTFSVKGLYFVLGEDGKTHRFGSIKTESMERYSEPRGLKGTLLDLQ